MLRAGRGAAWIVIAVAAIGCGNRPEAPGTAGQPAEPTGDEAGVTLSGRSPAGAIVLLQPTDARELPMPGKPAVMDQVGQQFYPGILLARAGQPVQFRNSEDQMHNVRVRNTDTDEAVFNVSTPPFKAYTHRFDEPGYYAVSCDIHPAMSASVLVTTTPHAAVAGSDGTVTFTGVTPGAYTLTAYITGRRVDRTVEITPSTTELVIDPS